MAKWSKKREEYNMMPEVKFKNKIKNSKPIGTRCSMGEMGFTTKIRKGRKKANWSKTRERYNVRFEIRIK